MITGCFICENCGQRYPVEDEVPKLAPPEANLDGARWDEVEIDARMSEWVAGNYSRALSHQPTTYEQDFVAAVQASTGPIIDLASGPGGSDCVRIMSDGGTDRQLVMSDLSEPVMTAWRRHLREKGWGDRCSTLVFDARQLPFADASVPVITSVIGFSSVVDSAFRAIREAARVLTDGGMIYTIESQIEREGLMRLCAKTGWNEHEFDDRYAMTYAEMFSACGLTIVHRRQTFRLQMTPDDNEIGIAAHQHGIEVWRHGEMYWVRK